MLFDFSIPSSKFTFICNLDSLLSLGTRYEYYEYAVCDKLYVVYSNNDMRSVALRVALSRQLVLISFGHVTSSS